MASQVLSGSSNPSYTNNTGQNVRIVINYMAERGNGISLNWAGISAVANLSAIGRNLATSYINISDAPNSPFATPATSGSTNISTTAAAYSSYGAVSNNNALAKTTTVQEPYSALVPLGNTTILGTAFGTLTTGSGALPTELMLAPGQTFSAVCGAYNIVVIPENG
jgi:hypothetical protein